MPGEVVTRVRVCAFSWCFDLSRGVSMRHSTEVLIADSL